MNFFRAFFQEYQNKCSSALNEVKIELLSKSGFSQKAHAKNQRPRTMLSYVYTLLKFPGE